MRKFRLISRVSLELGLGEGEEELSEKVLNGLVWAGPNVVESLHKDSITDVCVCGSCRHVVCQHGCRACLSGYPVS